MLLIFSSCALYEELFKLKLKLLLLLFVLNIFTGFLNTNSSFKLLLRHKELFNPSEKFCELQFIELLFFILFIESLNISSLSFILFILSISLAKSK